MRRLFLVSLLTLVFVGCATNAKYSNVLDSWGGVHVDELTTSWGSPDQSSTVADGRQIIEYEQQENVQSGGHTYVSTIVTMGATPHGGMRSSEVQKQAPVRDVSLWCKTTFIANSSGIITSATSEGNNCKGKPAS